MNNNENNLQKTFKDETGGKSTVIIEGENKTNLQKGKYKIVENIKTDTNKYLNKKPKGILTSDIGVHSEGFAPMITIASILAISVMVLLYVIFKF